MNVDTLLKKFKRSFKEIPNSDPRAKVGPRDFIVCLIFCFTQDRRKRSLESIRKSMMASLGVKLARSSFWERIATRRLFSLLLLLVQEAMFQIAGLVVPDAGKLLSVLRVKGILILDSTSMTLPTMAGAVFPGVRSNVAPAVIKWHNCFDLFGGVVKWFDISPGTSHDHNHFPDLKTLVGYLIIFDLGYFDYCLLQAIDNVGGLFLSRIKTNAVIQIDKVIQGLPKNFRGKFLFAKRLPKGKGIIEVAGLFHDGLFQFRVIGFWNPNEKIYHWYVTNLSVPAKLIYPLYRLRWAVELLFKTAKGSLRLSDISSADPNIVQSLVLASVVVTTLVHPLAFQLASLRHEEDGYKGQLPSLQRTGIVVVQLSVELRNFFLHGTKKVLDILINKLKLFIDELFDPNKNRENSMRRAVRAAGIMA